MGPGRLQQAFRRFATGLVAHPRSVLVAWLVVVVLATPWALRLPDVLAQQGASKIVPGTSSASVAQRLAAAFPQHSEREAVVVVSAKDTRSESVRRLLAVLDAAVKPMRERGQILSTTSAYTLRRDTALASIRAVIGKAGVTDARDETLAQRLARVDVAIDRAGVPRSLAKLIRQAATRDARTWPGLAGDFAVATDWRHYPVPVDDAMLVSRDGSTSLMTVGFSARGSDPNLIRLRSTVRRIVSGLGLSSAVHTSVTGELALIQDTYLKAAADNALMEQVAYVVILLVLLLFFRAVLPALLTVLMIGLAMNVSQAWLYLVGQHVALTQFTSTIMTFVMLGAGVDYSMLLSSRYRQERVAGQSQHEALVRAVTHAGESIALAGSAVVFAFAATLLAPVDWIPPLGYGGLVGVPIIWLAALTITPCLLALLGDRFFWLGWKPLSDLESDSGLARRLRSVARISNRSPLGVVAVFVVATIAFVLVASTHKLTADPVALSPATDARTGYQTVARHWGAGTLLPTVAVGPIDSRRSVAAAPSMADMSRLAEVSDAISSMAGVERVLSLTRPAGSPLSPAQQAMLPADVTRDYLAADGTTRIAVSLRGDPLSDEGRQTLKAIETTVRGSAMPWLQVGGATAVDQQYDQQLRASFWRMVSLVSGAIFVLLLVALRSLLVPLRLIVTIMMSNLWAVGITFLVFTVWLGDPVINDLPIFLIIMMMGLGMDYEIFLMTRVRDLIRRGMDDREAAMTAVVDTGRVITAAGLVMAGSLGTMALSSTLMLRQYGVGLGSAVLLDATLVRMLLVPASLLLLRRYNWWLPRWAGGGLVATP